jgi:hypothetical protein
MQRAKQGSQGPAARGKSVSKPSSQPSGTRGTAGQVHKVADGTTARATNRQASVSPDASSLPDGWEALVDTSSNAEGASTSYAPQPFKRFTLRVQRTGHWTPEELQNAVRSLGSNYIYKHIAEVYPALARKETEGAVSLYRPAHSFNELTAQQRLLVPRAIPATKQPLRSSDWVQYSWMIPPWLIPVIHQALVAGDGYVNLTHGLHAAGWLGSTEQLRQVIIAGAPDHVSDEALLAFLRGQKVCGRLSFHTEKLWTELEPLSPGSSAMEGTTSRRALLRIAEGTTPPLHISLLPPSEQRRGPVPGITLTMASPAAPHADAAGMRRFMAAWARPRRAAMSTAPPPPPHPQSPAASRGPRPPPPCDIGGAAPPAQAEAAMRQDGEEQADAGQVEGQNRPVAGQGVGQEAGGSTRMPPTTPSTDTTQAAGAAASAAAAAPHAHHTDTPTAATGGDRPGAHSGHMAADEAAASQAPATAGAEGAPEPAAKRHKASPGADTGIPADVNAPHGALAAAPADPRVQPSHDDAIMADTARHDGQATA